VRLDLHLRVWSWSAWSQRLVTRLPALAHLELTHLPHGEWRNVCRDAPNLTTLHVGSVFVPSDHEHVVFCLLVSLTRLRVLSVPYAGVTLGELLVVAADRLESLSVSSVEYADIGAVVAEKRVMPRLTHLAASMSGDEASEILRSMPALNSGRLEFRAGRAAGKTLAALIRPLESEDPSVDEKALLPRQVTWHSTTLGALFCDNVLATAAFRALAQLATMRVTEWRYGSAIAPDTRAVLGRLCSEANPSPAAAASAAAAACRNDRSRPTRVPLRTAEGAAATSATAAAAGPCADEVPPRPLRRNRKFFAPGATVVTAVAATREEKLGEKAPASSPKMSDPVGAIEGDGSDCVGGGGVVRVGGGGELRPSKRGRRD
jgi:hypothetical protein